MESSQSNNARNPGAFAKLHCEHLEIRIAIDPEKFRFQEFLKLGSEFLQQPLAEQGSATLGFLDSEYHVHFSWWQVDGKIRFLIGYHADEDLTNVNETVLIPVLKQDLVRWLGDLFVYPSAAAAITVGFHFEDHSRKSRYPLPIKVKLAQELETEIDGVSVRLLNEPNGVKIARLIQGAKYLSVQMNAFMDLTFADFDPNEQVRLYFEIVTMLTDEAKSV